MDVIRLLDAEGIDLIEISGGTYERPAMMQGDRKKSTVSREAYFLDYIEKARKLIKTPLLLTGGFRSVIGNGESFGGWQFGCYWFSKTILHVSSFSKSNF